MKKTNQVTSRLAQAKASLRSGFSLIELLVVIAVIGIIAAIAIPNIAGLTGGAKSAKNLRNAQSVASVFSAAKAADATIPATVVDEDTAIDAMVAGVAHATSGATFKVPMSATEVTALKGDTDAMATLTYTATPESLEYTTP